MKKQKSNVLNYSVVFEEGEKGGYTVTVPALSGCISEGDTFEEAKLNIAEAITAYLESLAKDGQKVPPADVPLFIGNVQVHSPNITP